MSLPIKQTSSINKSKSPSKIFLQKTSPQTKKTTLANIPDDVLSSYFYKPICLSLSCKRRRDIAKKNIN